MQRIETEVVYTKLAHYVENPANLSYATEGSACFDICAAIKEPLTLAPGEHVGVPTGLKIAAEAPLWFRINSRSGLAIRYGIITIAGIIDTDYRGEWIVGLLNTNAAGSGKSYTITPGDKIAQVELPFPYHAVFREISQEAFDELSTTRGEAGFGSSGR